MKDEIKIRNGKPEDIEFIYQLLKDVTIENGIADRYSQTKGSLHQALFSENCIAEVLIAECNDVSVGLGLFSITNHNFYLFKGAGIYVHGICVIPEYRRNKIATSLANKIRDIAKDRNCDRIDGVVIKNNEKGVYFYKSLKDTNVVDYISYVRAKV